LFKPFSCLVVIVWSPWISLAKRSHSSFALVVSYVQVRNCFVFPAMLTRVVGGMSKPLRVGLCTGILMLRALMDVILFQGEENILNVREITSANPDISLKHLLGFNLL
jgi:hypothetical protein